MSTYPAANKGRGGRIPVRGVCPAQHVTEVVSEPGRITWTGECAADGCGHRITARRIPATPGKDQPPDDVHTPPEPEPETVKEVSYEQQPQRRREPDRVPASGAGDVPGSAEGAGAPVRDVDEHDAAAEYERDEPEPPRGTVDPSGSGLVDQTPPRRRRFRRETRHEFRLPWD